MELSLEDPMRCTLLARSGPIVVNLPRPARYAIQAGALVDYLLTNDALEFGLLWRDVNARGPGWRRRLNQGYQAMRAQHPECDFDGRFNAAVEQAKNS